MSSFNCYQSILLVRAVRVWVFLSIGLINSLKGRTIKKKKTFAFLKFKLQTIILVIEKPANLWQRGPGGELFSFTTVSFLYS